MRILPLLASLLLASAASAATADFRLPSDSTGDTGGTLAVRAYFPDSAAAFRYGSGGAPVVVQVPGGFGAGTFALSEANTYLAQGFVVLTFLFPGGTDGAATSDGVYDDRGDASQRALRDVLRFATGDIEDSLGRDLAAITGGPIAEHVVGIAANSNGGTISICTLGRFGDQIPPVAFLVPWESPCNTQALTGEVGARGMDVNTAVDSDGDGLVENDVVNGAFTAYSFPEFTIDYSRLRYDPDVEWRARNGGVPVGPVLTGLFYLENSGNDSFDQSAAQTTFSDTDGDGIIEATEDFALAGLSVRLVGDTATRAMLSLPAGAAAHALGLDTWPAHYHHPTVALDYWSIRDTAQWHDDAMAKQPTIAGISSFSVQDHVQTSRLHPHVLHYHDIFRSAGHWYRLNADRAYAEAVSGIPQPNARDNDANGTPAPAAMPQLAQPLDGPPTAISRVAASAELADRTFYGVWDDNLEAIITESAASIGDGWAILGD